MPIYLVRKEDEVRSLANQFRGAAQDVQGDDKDRDSPNASYCASSPTSGTAEIPPRAGPRMCLRDVVMDFPYLEGYKGLVLDAYERVLSTA